MSMIPVIFGLSGLSLTDTERDFFRDADPAGYILFARNCRDKDQLRALTDDLRDLSGRADVPILIDQEGGRVARLPSPEWPLFPPQWRFAELYQRAPISAIEVARCNAAMIAAALTEAGINVDCLPLLDVRREGADDIIGDRALGDNPMQVAALGKAVLDGLESGGVCGVIKHIPGHGRARADSHKELPVVDAPDDDLETDITPFRALAAAPMGMTAHVLYTAWDKERCGSISPVVIGEIIRGRIGFHNFLMSDDIGMSALGGGMAERARAVVDAGCDAALHCSGDLGEMKEIADALGPMGEAARGRLDRAMARIKDKKAVQDPAALAAKRDALLNV